MAESIGNPFHIVRARIPSSINFIQVIFCSLALEQRQGRLTLSEKSSPLCLHLTSYVFVQSLTLTLDFFTHSFNPMSIGRKLLMRKKAPRNPTSTARNSQAFESRIPIPNPSVQKAIAQFLLRVRQRQHDASIDLPDLPAPISDQRRIVAKIDQLAAKIAEARGLQDGISNRCDRLCRAILNGADDTPTIPMRRLVALRDQDVQVDASSIYHFAGVYCFGRGVFRSQQRSGLEFAYKELTRLRAGNFVYPKLMAWEGALGVVPPECDGLVVSPEFPVFEIDQSRVLPDVLDVYFRSPDVWPRLSGASTGTNVRRRRLNPQEFLNFCMPVPPMTVQRRLQSVKARVDRLKQLQSATAAELDALLPAVLDKAFKGEL